MFSKELLEFIDKVDLKLSEKYTSDFDKDKIVLLQMMKVNEEIGELCDEILALNGCQREEKLVKHNKETLEGEAVDVLFAFLILMKKMDVDIDSAVNRKMIEIKKRFEIK